ncbi:hypothetical protein BDV33DRAFT_134690 [Aspergillus novoparasiticus]|uniref:Uncharacterized protein n=1 Tax=Aspergillus novoparasiticus TaxID=986946 RepID=A0A5N6F7Q8_9EURO|nr:hypothetical protein BDV33DRAFT_134690 [Aspergillus novoparasiticus]
MATTSSLAFSAMETPALDDTMEMASPYQGHADDFDIDLDDMDDQASNTDKDMMGADEYEEAFHGTEYEQDGPNDADMIDEVAEPAMLDMDDQYAETSYSVEMQYGTEKIYEAEMLEDDYDEDIDAPVPEAPVPESQEAPASLEPADNQVTSEHILTEKNDGEEATSENYAAEARPGDNTESAHLKNDALEEVPPEHHHQDENNIIQETEVDRPESADVDNNVVDTNQPEQVDIHEIPGDHEDHTAGAESPEAHEDDAGENRQTADENKELESEETKTTEHDTERDEPHGQETELAEHDEQEQGTTKDSSLYPVRVYYQDNEISLFPPKEGDSSETFFLEDENLAYAPLGELFQSCRQVLQDNVGDNEVLIMDVDALNIQLTEDSLHISKLPAKEKGCLKSIHGMAIKKWKQLRQRSLKETTGKRAPARNNKTSLANKNVTLRRRKSMETSQMSTSSKLRRASRRNNVPKAMLQVPIYQVVILKRPTMMVKLKLPLSQNLGTLSLTIASH